MSHVIPSRLFHDLNCDVGIATLSRVLRKVRVLKLRATFGEGEACGRGETPHRWDLVAGASRAPASAFGEVEPTCGPISEGLATIRSFVTACRARPRGAPIC